MDFHRVHTSPGHVFVQVVAYLWLSGRLRTFSSRHNKRTTLIRLWSISHPGRFGDGRGGQGLSLMVHPGRNRGAAFQSLGAEDPD